MWNLKCRIIPVIIGATGIVTRGLRKRLEAVPGKHSIDSLQKADILGTSHIIRKVLQCEAWSLSGGDHCWFKRITRKKRPVTRDIKSRIIFRLNGIMSYPCICRIACHIYMVRCDVQRSNMQKQIDATRYIVPYKTDNRMSIIVLRYARRRMRIVSQGRLTLWRHSALRCDVTPRYAVTW